MDFLKRVLEWAGKNERHIGAVLFVFGFITDLFTFAFTSVTFVNFAFLGYLVLAGICTFGSHLFSGAREHPTTWRRTLSIVFPLGAQYAIGSLLSGCLIFYGKSAAVLVSWPFLLILVAVFIGNEYFRTYYKHLAFQLVLFFFGIYAYAIFALPLLVHKLGPWIFLASSVIAILVFVVFLYAISRVHRPGFLRSLRYVVPGTAVIILLINTCYFTGIIPPIPLTMPSAGIYHSVVRQDNQYIVTTENDKKWWDISSQVIHHVPGSQLYAFSSVSAPFDFGATIVHSWEWYDPTKEKWVERSKVAFIISGGRDGGYRGYSVATDPAVGKWRVSIETTDGQIIGRLYFTVENVDVAPLIKQESK